jgi:hypothetical protein
MANPAMKKFLVLYLVPAQVMVDWAKTDPQTRKAAERKDAWRLAALDGRTREINYRH